MKTFALLAAAGLAASSPLAAAPEANLSSFYLRAHTPGGTGELEGMYAAQLNSTSAGPTILAFSNDTSQRLQFSTSNYCVKVVSPAPAPGAKASHLFYKYVGPGANIIPMNVGPHAPEAGFEVETQKIDGVKTQVMAMGTSDTSFSMALGCPVTTQDGAKAFQVTFFSGTHKKPAGCQLVALELV